MGFADNRTITEKSSITNSMYIKAVFVINQHTTKLWGVDITLDCLCHQILFFRYHRQTEKAVWQCKTNYIVSCFWGLKFCGLGRQDNFVGSYFRGIPMLIT